MSDVEHALPKGTRIAGYEITGCLGAGGFGITYAAFNKHTGRHVAIKEFFPFGVASRSETSTDLLVREGQEQTMSWALRKFETTTADLCRLTHPNIVRVIDYYPGNQTGFMVMEYLRGMTLGAWLADRERPPRPSELEPLMEPVLDALEHLHSLGLVHRDIAPDNIFICDDNRPVLIDFGAASHDRSTQGSAAKSTVIIKKKSFTAPDQARGLSLPNPTADVYSFGAVLYQALSGEPPEDGEERMGALLLGSGDAYRSLETEPPVGTSRTMARAIDQCLSLMASERPQSIRIARRLFDWKDDVDQNDVDHARFDLDHHPEGFSIAHDVIEAVQLDPLDRPDPPPHPPAEIIPPPPPLPPSPRPRRLLIGLALTIGTLVIAAIALGVWALAVRKS